MNKIFRKNGSDKNKKKVVDSEIEIVKKQEADFGEIAAVIGLTLDIYLKDIHDYENTIITMQKVMRPYSPWSSKIYNLREIPMRIPGYRQIIKK